MRLFLLGSGRIFRPSIRGRAKGSLSGMRELGCLGILWHSLSL